MKQLRRPSQRQLMLLESEVTIQLDEKARQEVIGVLADLLLEALGEGPVDPVGVPSESED